MNSDSKNQSIWSCRQCGENEFITALNSYDRYEAINDKLVWRATELANATLKLYCRACGERAPTSFENAAK